MMCRAQLSFSKVLRLPKRNHWEAFSNAFGLHVFLMVDDPIIFPAHFIGIGAYN